MQLIHMIDGCLDGGDFAGAAAAILAHPFGKRLDRPAVERLFGIMLGKPAEKIDVAMLGLLGEMVHIDEEISQ